MPHTATHRSQYFSPFSNIPHVQSTFLDLGRIPLKTYRTLKGALKRALKGTLIEPL